MFHARQWLKHTCLIICSCLVSSCLDLREEIWIHNDGSAEAEITCIMPASSTLAFGGVDRARKKIDKILEEQTRIDSHEVQVTKVNKQVIIKVRCKVDESLSLDNLRESIQSQEELPLVARKMAGEFEFGIEGLSGVSISRTVSPGEAIPTLRWLPKSKLEEHRIVKIMHFPSPIKKHNAHDSWDGGRSLMWDSTLFDAVNSPLVYQFVVPYPKPLVWTVVAAITLIGAFVCLVVTLIVRHRRRSKKSARKK